MKQPFALSSHDPVCGKNRRPRNPRPCLQSRRPDSNRGPLHYEGGSEAHRITTFPATDPDWHVEEKWAIWEGVAPGSSHSVRTEVVYFLLALDHDLIHPGYRELLAELTPVPSPSSWVRPPAPRREWWELVEDERELARGSA